MPYDTESDDTGKKRLDKVLEEAKERFECCQSRLAERRSRSLDDLDFLDGAEGKQWGAQVYQKRMLSGRPTLTVNRLDQFVQHITNALSQNQISARVSPVDDNSDPETAELIQGLLRHIEYNSDAQLAYGTGAFYAVASGEGFWINRTRYISPMSFDTEIIIERVNNPFQIFLDPDATHPAGKDAKYGFKVTSYSKEEYKRAFPKSDVALASDWSTVKVDNWIDDEHVQVAEYPCIEYTEDTLVRLQDGTARLKSDLGDDWEEQAQKGPDGPITRDTCIEVVKWYKLNGMEVLEETVWPTQPDYVSIPIVRVVGNELDINGKTILKGIIRNLKDAQRQYNFMLSAQTEAIDSSKGQIVIEDGQIEGHEAEWADATNRKILTVTGKSVEGRPAKDPTRLVPNQSIQSMTEARLMAADDLKALTGIYDAALGQKSNETSGVAIRGRQMQSETANYHFTGNLVRSVNHSSILIINAIPSVIDTPRAVRIIGEDEMQKVVQVNQHLDPAFEPEGEPIYRLDTGRYDVVCEAGPSTATLKEERRAQMTEIVKVAPGLMQVAPDLILKDLGASPALVERVRKTLPPELQDDKKDGQPDAAALQGQLQQMTQQNQMLQQALQEASSPITMKKMELESKERMESARMEHEVQLKNIDVQLKDMEIKSKAVLDTLKHDSAEAMAVYQAETTLLSKGIERDAAAQEQEAQEAKATAEKL